MIEHDFVEVLNRRWCLCCDLFQSKKDDAANFPKPRKSCARDTPRARAMDKARSEASE